MEKKRNLIRFSVGVFVSLLVLAPLTVWAATTEAAKKAPVKIGIIAGITGYYAYESAALVDGAKLAIKQFNEAGGILGGLSVGRVHGQCDYAFNGYSFGQGKRSLLCFSDEIDR